MKENKNITTHTSEIRQVERCYSRKFNGLDIGRIPRLTDVVPCNNRSMEEIVLNINVVVKGVEGGSRVSETKTTDIKIPRQENMQIFSLIFIKIFHFHPEWEGVLFYLSNPS